MKFPLFDLYAVLGVSSKASYDDIRKAYRAAARRFHPDVNAHEGAALQFRDIAAAYDILSETATRNAYQRHYEDRHWICYTSGSVPSKRVLSVLPEPQVLYLLLKIEPRTKDDTDKHHRRNVNISLILDRSASMRGVRMDRVKIAAHQITGHLGDKDRLSIVTFSDRAEVVYRSNHVKDRNSLKALINGISVGGGTEIYQGLLAGFRQVKAHFNRNMVNHIILITDGKTYGDEPQSLELAKEARQLGIGISAMGIGEEWNDEFLDELASQTGGAATYINSPAAVVQFLDKRIRTLGEAFAERLQLTVAPASDVTLESVFRLMPSAQPLDHKTQPIKLGQLSGFRPMRVLLQFLMPANMKDGFRSVARLDVTGDILGEGERFAYKAISDQSVEISHNPPSEEPPTAILDALGKYTLYRMQQKAEEAITAGQITEATRRLQNLSTRLLESGHNELAHMARSEAQRVSQNKELSEAGRRSLKFGTRLLLAPPE